MPEKIKTFRTNNYNPEDTEERRADRRFYASAAWRKLASAYRTAFPLCQCADNCGQLAEQVHHIIDRKERPDLALDWDNLQVLTRRCHSRITAHRKLRMFSASDGDVQNP